MIIAAIYEFIIPSDPSGNSALKCQSKSLGRKFVCLQIIMPALIVNNRKIDAIGRKSQKLKNQKKKRVKCGPWKVFNLRIRRKATRHSFTFSESKQLTLLGLSVKKNSIPLAAKFAAQFYRNLRNLHTQPSWLRAKREVWKSVITAKFAWENCPNIPANTPQIIRILKRMWRELAKVHAEVISSLRTSVRECLLLLLLWRVLQEQTGV